VITVMPGANKPRIYVCGRHNVRDNAERDDDRQTATVRADDAGRITAFSGTVAVVTAFWKTTDARTVY